MKLILKAYKFKLKPTDAQREQFSRYAGINRFLWNKALSINLHRLENKQPIMWEYELSFWNTLWKKTEEYSFLKNAPSQTLVYTLSYLNVYCKILLFESRIPRRDCKILLFESRIPRGRSDE